MAFANKTAVELDPNYDYEDPAMHWIDLVMATRELDHDLRMRKINELCLVAKNSHWTHALWDQVCRELETPEYEVLDGDSPTDSDEDAATDTLATLPYPEHHSYREDSQWDQ